MDNSPGQPNTPAISDANMSVQMDYLHMQNSTLLNAHTDCIGVPVTLTAVDPNGNSINLGTVTSDSSGQFASSFTPTTAGLYTIYATFTDSNSYYSSYGETHATVASSSTSAGIPTPTAASVVSNSSLLYGILAGVIVAIILGLIAVFIALRKKP